MTEFKFDTWEETDYALKAINRLFFVLHENKPSKGSPLEIAWEKELKEVRRWAVSIHNRRIALNIKSLKNA